MWRDKEREALEREDRILASAEPHEHITYFLGVNTKALLSELRMIRWLLFFILIMLVTFAHHTLPSGWWYQSWWS